MIATGQAPRLYELAPLVGACVAAFVHAGLTRFAGRRPRAAAPAATSVG